LHGLYDRDRLLLGKTTLEEAPAVFQVTAVAVLLLWFVQDLLLSSPLRHSVALAAGALLFTLVLGARWVARALCARLAGPERCLFIGRPRTFDHLVASVGEAANAEVVGHLSLAHAHAAIDSRAASAGALRRLIADRDVQRAIIEAPDGAAAPFSDVVRAAKQVGVRVSILTTDDDVFGSSSMSEELGGMTLRALRGFGLTRSASALKRTMDVAGSLLLLAALVPLLVAIAVAIKLDSRGPLLFRQRRIGRDGHHFDILKFRSMVVDAEARKDGLRALNETEGIFKIADDPRITRVGRLLRCTTLDELPQLLNVLRGDMSLVGPRPLVVDEDALVTGWDRRRLHLKPGMTGPWQIAGRTRLPLPEMVRIDYRYVAEWSVWNDLKILLRTVPYVVARRGM